MSEDNETLIDNLNSIKNSKADIKQALINKGQTPTDVFNTYAGLIENISGGGGTGDAQVYSSVEEMNEHTDLPENTYAIVAGTNLMGVYLLLNHNWLQVGDPAENLQAFNNLQAVQGVSNLKYEGVGDTEQNVMNILNTVINGEGE